MHVLLVHSPLVGPATLRRLGAELTARGHVATVPDLRAVAVDPTPTAMVDLAIAATDAPVDVVVAHSGAGAVLPSLAVEVAARGAVFLDAVLPDSGADRHVTEPAQVRLFDANVEDDGLLRPWLSWWPADTVVTLLPDPSVREAVSAELPRLPRSFYDHAVRLPSAWPPSAYVALSGAYLDELDRARSRGWPTRSLGLTHLATVTHAPAVTDALLEVVDDLLSSGPPWAVSS